MTNKTAVRPTIKNALIFLYVFSIPFSSSAAVDPFRKISKDLLKGVKTSENPRVGLLAFPYHDGKISSGSSIVSERLTTELASAKKIRVVERNLIKKILEERRMAETGVIDPTTAREIGKILSLDIIITGTLIDVESNKTEINARALKADTGEVLAAARALITRSWQDRPRAVHPPRPRSSFAEPEEKPVANEAIEIGPPAVGRSSRGTIRR